MRQSLVGSAFRIFIALFVLTGVVYPAVVTGISQLAFSEAANGSLIKDKDRFIGSKLLAQKFVGPQYFHPRPSAGDFNTLSSGGSNLSPIAATLKAQAEAVRPEVPRDLVFASASGLDPHITPEGARSQIARVAEARRVSVEKITKLVGRAQEPRQFGFLGEPRVNVLVLNALLDHEP